MNEKVKVKQTSAPEEMPVLALRGLVLFPHMVLHFDVGREKSIMALNEAMTKGRRVFLVAQRDIKDDDPTLHQLYQVGVVAEVRQIVRAQGDTLRVLVDGVSRGRLLSLTSDTPFLSGVVEEYPVSSRISNRAMCDALMRTVKELFEEYCYLTPKMPKELVSNVMVTEDPFYMAEYITGNIPLRFEDKQRVLEESTVIRRLETVAKLLENENEILSLEQDIHEKVREQIDKNQREFYLREQMKAISSELGEGDNLYEELEEYQDKILKLRLPKESEDKLLKELDKLEKMPPNSHEGAVIRGYLDVCLELPWNTFTKDKIDIKKARRYLDQEHYGLMKVKERILELLAVRKLSPDIKGQIICLIGPPGVGKTSIARSIASSMGRKYARMSLGGVRDESDIRGHRKTYIGSMPGRIINAIKQAGSANPLLLLDEIDKLGNDFRGDPSSALLEVLDAEQNSAFRDHFIEIPFDLSKVLFIATANSRETIPGPLLDRMEIIELTSYTREEKLNIAKRHLVAKQMKAHGIETKQLKINDTALYGIIDYYTREAGVRNLERLIATICRKAAVRIVENAETAKISVTAANLEEFLGPKKFRDDEMGKVDQVGVANGLAWTSVGGEMLQVETAVMDGSGKNQFTGSLGDVMKESVAAAITYIRGVACQYGISETFYKDKDIHIHFPEGAVPKDGPSAGITTCTALISALSGIPIRHDVAMTGEITLRGRVLAIGGLREKTMAAYKNGMTTVIIPKANVPDLAEVDDVVKEHIHFVPADNMETVLQTALTHLPGAILDKKHSESEKLLAAASAHGAHKTTRLRQ
ncbi:MAG: endopeptidase La [Angelakisella sp.]|nr:endopeptidase La [Angelakisella sp.]